MRSPLSSASRRRPSPPRALTRCTGRLCDPSLCLRHQCSRTGANIAHASSGPTNGQRRTANPEPVRCEYRRCLEPIMRGEVMKIVVIGGTGLIGSKVVETLKQKGHDVIAAAPNTGVNTITGEGLKEAMAGAQVVIDLANSPSFEDKAVL